jgi:hypothetical protein
LITAASAVLAIATAASAQQASQDIAEPPACRNNKGEDVRFVVRDGSGASIAAGMAARDPSGAPVVFRSNYPAAPLQFQRFIDRHECAHHQTGDVDRPHPPRNGPEHLMNESVSDCVAILRMRDEDGMDADAFRAVTSALRDSMQGVGFPEISISSRISNITNCFENHAGAGQLIEHVLEQRGLN